MADKYDKVSFYSYINASAIRDNRAKRSITNSCNLNASHQSLVQLCNVLKIRPDRKKNG